VTWTAIALEFWLGEPLRTLGSTELEPGVPEIHIDYLNSTGEVSVVRILQDGEFFRDIPINRIVLRGEDLTVELEEGFWEGIS